MKTLLLALAVTIPDLTGYALAAIPDSPETARIQLENAETLQRNAQALRNQAEEFRKQGKQACAPVIFVTACEDRVRNAYIDQMKKVRAMETEANELSRTAKTYDQQQHQAELRQKKASAPSSQQENALVEKKETGRTIPKPPAPDPVKAEAQDKQAHEKAAKAEQAHQQAIKEATKRAEQARADAKRYDRNLAEHAKRNRPHRHDKQPASPDR